MTTIRTNCATPLWTMLRPRTLRRRSGVACRSTVWRARSCASLLGGNDFGVAAHEITGRVPEEVSHATGTSNGLPHAGSGRPVLIHSCQLVDHADGPRNDSAESRKSHRAATFDFSWRPCSTLLAGKRNATRSSLWHYAPVATSHDGSAESRRSVADPGDAQFIAASSAFRRR